MSTGVDKPEGDASVQETWNTPEAIARHRKLTPGERIKKASQLSNQALKLARARRLDADA